jgi:hypothetical protein
MSRTWPRLRAARATQQRPTSVGADWATGKSLLLLPLLLLRLLALLLTTARMG